jgi:hypothetical protein
MNLFFRILRFVYPIIVILSIFSCSRQEDERIISRDEFINIITDLHCVDAIIMNKGFTSTYLKDSAQIYTEFVLKKYNITRKSFDNSLAYYSNDLNDFLAMYDEVIKKINALIPITLNNKSIYKIIDLAIEDAKIKSDLDKYFGQDGILLWNENKGFEILEKDTAHNKVFKGKLKYQGLLLLETNVMIYPEDSSKNMRMKIKIRYKDKTFDKAEKAISGKANIWTNNHLFIRTNRLKKTDSIECYAFAYDTLIGKKHVMVKDVYLKQFGPKRDTTGIVKLPTVETKQKANKKISSPKKKITKI